MLVSSLIALDLAVIVFFAYLHFRLLAWNLREYALFKKTEAYPKLMSSNAEITLMAIPLGTFVGQAYDGTILPLISGFLIFGVAATVALFSQRKPA